MVVGRGRGARTGTPLGGPVGQGEQRHGGAQYGEPAPAGGVEDGRAELGADGSAGWEPMAPPVKNIAVNTLLMRERAAGSGA
jgi:hypothetical protein